MNVPVLWIILLIVGLLILLLLRKLRQRLESLNAETYNKLKSNFDARRIMGELNYIIKQINEYREQNEYLEKYHEDNMYARLMSRLALGEELYKIKKEGSILYRKTNNILNDYIRKEWDMRIRILDENSICYYSEKDLRDAYTQFREADREIQSLTIWGRRVKKFKGVVEVAGITLVASAGLALVAVGVANRATDRQSFRDNFGV